MSQAEYARHLERTYGKKITRQGINKLIGSVIPLRDDRKIDSVEADAAMIRRGLLHIPAIQPEQLEPQLSFDKPADPQGRDLTRPPGYWDVKAESEAVQKKLLDLKYEEAVRNLLRTADVTDAMVLAGRKIRTALEAIPSLSDELTAAALSGGSHEVRTLLRGQIRKLEQQISDSLTLLAVDDDDGDDTRDNPPPSD